MLGLLETMSFLITAVLGLSLAQGLTRWYWDSQYRDKQKPIVYSILIFLTLIGAVFLVLSYFFSGFISKLLFSNSSYAGIVYSVIVASVLQVILTILQTLMKIQQKPKLFTITNILRLIFTLFLTIYFVVYQKQSVQGIYTAQIIGNIVFILLCIKYIRNIVEVRFEKTILKEMVIYSAPLILASISSVLISFQDRYILNHYADLNKVGIYTFAYRIANSIKFLIVSSIQMAVSPMIYQMMGEKNSLRFYSKYMTYFSFIVGGLALVLNLFSYEIVKIMGQNVNYWSAATVIPIISFSLYFDMLKDTSLTGLQIKKKTKLISAIVIFISILNLGLSFLLIPKWHYYGAAVATLISEIIYFFLIYYYAQRHYRIPYELNKVFKIIIVISIFTIISYYLNGLPLLYRLIIKTSMIASFPFILYALNFYETIELERLKEAYQKWKNPLKWKNSQKRF
jgi:O-antigen/teichoic acid export membrane protein